jgi:uncharacterized SAM-binding protein YcdF (DUF218 family)
MKIEPIHDIESLAAASLQKTSNKNTPSSPFWRLFFAAPLCALVIFLGGFIFFAANLNSKENINISQADAIVALTGGSDRIADAVELLANNKGKRLLISGVNLSTSVERLSQIAPLHRDFFACCIDIDYAARNTVENAIETRRWVEERGINSLIVVTSNYHMPRAMIELQRAMPNVKLIEHPIISERTATGDILTKAATSTKIIGIEYTKFLVSYARSVIAPKLDLTASTIPIVTPLSTGSIKRPLSYKENASINRKT